MFYSILFPTREQHEKARNLEPPACFKDLNLQRIIDGALRGKSAFELESVYYTPLTDAASIRYRQDVMRELEEKTIRKPFALFSDQVNFLEKCIKEIRRRLTGHDPWENNYLARGRLLDYADQYCRAVQELYKETSTLEFRSEGLSAFIEYFRDYACSEAFQNLASSVAHIRQRLSTVEYCMLVKGGTIRVRKYEGQEDHSKQILAAFEKFRQGDVKDYRKKLTEEPRAEHVEAAVLELVAGLYKDEFRELNAFCTRYLDFTDDCLLRFSGEIQFYIAWLDYTQFIHDFGLPFNYPRICDTAEHLYARNCFDLALASAGAKGIVPNDFELHAPERIIVITGPNQGGKTTFARTFGQIHYLASLGVRVPGSESALYLFDRVLTHFGREEDLSSLSGKLQDDLVRLHDLLGEATSKSIIIVNEIFASTTLSDAQILGGYMMDAISVLGAPAVVVTFLDELALHGPDTVSMMSTVKEDNPEQRTFRILRKAPDGLAYAMYIAGRHGLTYEQLDRRLKA